jgi:hypothetical protein
MLEQDQLVKALVAPFRRFNALAHEGVFGLLTSLRQIAVKSITRRFCRDRTERLPWRSHQSGERND